MPEVTDFVDFETDKELLFLLFSFPFVLSQVRLTLEDAKKSEAEFTRGRLYRRTWVHFSHRHSDALLMWLCPSGSSRVRWGFPQTQPREEAPAVPAETQLG